MSTRRVPTLLSLLVLCALVATALGRDARSVTAQGARIVVRVAEETIAAGELTQVELVVENVASLWSGQLALRFDPTVVQVVDAGGEPTEVIEAGDLLEAAQRTEFVNAVDAAAGRVEYAATLRNNPRRPVEPASGSGVFARFRLRGLRGGATALAFSTEGARQVREILFVDGDLAPFTLPTADGQLVVEGGGPAPIYLPYLTTSGAGLVQHNAGAAAPPDEAGWFSADGRPVRAGGAPARLLDDPELVVETNGRLVDLAVNGGYAYWTEAPAEFGCDDPDDEGRIARVNLATGVEETIGRSCDLAPGQLVVDGGSLCFVEVDGDGIGCTGSTPDSDGDWLTLWLAGGNGLASRSPLAIDATHLYWSDRDGIKRVPRTPGAPETLVAGHSPTYLLVDGGYVYWIENGEPGGVYRVPVGGGAPEALHEEAEPAWMTGVAVDGGHVYWTESGGVARRVAKTGGTPQSYGRDGSWLAGEVAVDDTHVFWSDEVRLRRAPKDHSEAPEALALDFPGIRGLQATDDALVWAGGRGVTGIWTIPLAASEVTVDLRINWIEVTQAIQNLVNDVPLVANKDTLVRVYPASDWAYTHDVPMVLHGRRDGAALPGSPLEPIVPRVTVARDGAERERMDETFNFLLPDAWTTGSVALRAEINPGPAIPEANRTNNELTERVTFTRRDAMCLEMISVNTVPRTAVARGDGFESIMAWVQSAYPVPGLRVRRGPTIYEPDVCFWHGLPYPCRGPYEMPDDSGWVLSRIWWHNLWTGNDAGCDTTFYVGMVHQDGIVRDGTIGSSYVGGRELWAMMDTDPEVLDGRWPWFLPFGGPIMAHEIGHSLDRRHVDCGDPADDSIQPGYPYDPCDMGDDDPAGYYGMRLPDLALIAPTEAGDLMSYAFNEDKPVWPSDWTYGALRGRLPGDFAALDAAGPGRPAAPGHSATTMTDTDALVASLAQSAESLAVTGVVSPTAGTAELLEVKRFPTSLAGAAKLAELASRVRTSPTGAYVLSLRDANDVVSRELRFDVPEEIDAYDEVRTFQLVLPYVPTTARIVLSEGGAERAARKVSANPPTVKLSSPNGGEDVTGPLQVTWQAEDPDDDALTYTVQYSPDAGVSWRPLVVDIFTTTFTVEDMSTVPGSEQALVRVIAADGVHTASDVSDAPFRVARSAPEVTILRPHDGAVVAPEQQIIAQGSAYDAEDGTLDGDALRWFADGEPVGRGAMVAIPALDPGEHTLTLRAVDRDQQEGEASIRIYVQDLACENAEAVDVVFVLDTSPPMAEAFDDACALTKDVVAALQSEGLAVRWRVLGVTQRRGCATAMLRDVLKRTAVDHPADWGLAVRDLAQGYPWRPGAARLIVPISNQGPENGDPVEDPGADRKVVEAAAQVASRAGVRVAPVLMPTFLGPQPEPPEMPVARSLALGTGGKLFAWQGQPQRIAGAIARLIPTGSCAPSVIGVSPVCGFGPDTTLTLHGENLAVGTQVWVGAQRALAVEASADGRRLTFKLPPILVVNRSYDVRVERTGVGGASLQGAITTGPCSVRCDDYVPGDITVPMWRLREAQGEVRFEARAVSDTLQVRLYAADGPVKLLLYALDGTYLDGTPVPTGATRTVSLPATPGTSYQIVVRNAHDPATRFRLYARGAAHLRTADDGDGYEGDYKPGRGEDHGAASHPELGFAERWRDLDPAFATTTWYFDVAPGERELAVQIWSEIRVAYGHGGMAWLRPDGSVQPLVGPEASGFDHTWRVMDPMPGMWGLRIASTEEYIPPVVVDPPDDGAPEIVYYYLDFPVQGYSLARLGEPTEDWLYLLPNSMLGPPCGPTLLLRPVATSICRGGVQRMDIVLADVANLYGAELHLSFDEERLKAVDEKGEEANQMIPGPMLDPRKGLVGANAVDNRYGLIDYAVSLKDPAPPAFGTGRLGSVYFQALAEGRAEITVDEVKLSERPLPPLPAVRPAADARGASYEPAACDDGAGGQGRRAALHGRVRVDGRVDHGGARVALGALGPYLSDADGAYAVTGLPPGEHSLDVSLAGYLRAGARAVTLGAGETAALPPLTLLGGDCDGSDRIDIVDGAIAARFFGTSEGWAAGKQPDINADGVVDIFDLVMLGGNFGCAVEDTDERCRRWGR